MQRLIGVWENLFEVLPSAVLFFDQGKLAASNAAANRLFELNDAALGLPPKEILRDSTLVQAVKECQLLDKRVSVTFDLDGRVYKCDAAPAGAMLESSDNNAGGQKAISQEGSANAASQSQGNPSEETLARPLVNPSEETLARPLVNPSDQFVHTSSDKSAAKPLAKHRPVVLMVTDITMASSSSFARRDFITNVSHELKTPVTAIQALAESLSLAFERDPERAKTMCGRIEAEAFRLTKLVRELLDLARYEEEAHGDMQLINLADLCANQVLRVQELALSKQLTITTNVPSDLTLITFPPALKLIISNLLSNAVMYNKEAGSIHLMVYKELNSVVITVEDTGIGIAKNVMPRIFERFYRVDKARSRSAGGTGLGLSLVKQAVEQLNGDIKVHSELNVGTTMSIFLPVDGSVE